MNTPYLQSTEAHGRFSAIALMMAVEALANGSATMLSAAIAH